MNTNSVYGLMKSGPARMMAMIVTMALVVAGSFSMFSAPANAANDLNNVDEVNEMLDYINEYRDELGLQQVKVNTTISEVSLDWTVYLADSGAFSHNPNYGKDSRVYSGWSSAGEIIAMNGHNSVRGMFEQWVASPGHHRIMIDPDFNLVGIGLAESKEGFLYGTVNFYNYRYLAGVPNTYDVFPDPSDLPVEPPVEKPTDPVEPPVEEEPEPVDPVEPPVEEPSDPVKPVEPPVEEPKPTKPADPKPTQPVDPKPTTPAKPTFTDVTPKNSIFYDEIEALSTKRITTGWNMPNGTKQYRPLAPINRDAMIVFIYRSMGSPSYTPPRVSPFADVKTNNMYYKEIAWAHSMGISRGWSMPNGTAEFRPLEPVKRDAMAAFLMRASGDKTPAPAKSFKDVRPTQEHAAAITWMKNEKISTGWGDNTYRPLNNTNRDAMAAFLIRWMEHTN